MTENTKSNTSLKIALLIDCDNISFRAIEQIIPEIEQLGDIIIKRAFGNWTKEYLKEWDLKLSKLSIKPIHQVDYTKGKNATDMAIVIDAMKILFEKPNIDCFILLTSDSDFTPLVMTLKEESKKVYGYGYSHTPEALKNSFTKFIDVSSFVKNEDIIKPSKEIISLKKNRTKKNNTTITHETKKFPKIINNKTKEIILSLFEEHNTINEYTVDNNVASAHFNKILKEHGINHKDFGNATFHKFIQNLDLFHIHTDPQNNQNYLTLLKN